MGLKSLHDEDATVQTTLIELGFVLVFTVSILLLLSHQDAQADLQQAEDTASKLRLERSSARQSEAGLKAEVAELEVALNDFREERDKTGRDLRTCQDERSVLHDLAGGGEDALSESQTQQDKLQQMIDDCRSDIVPPCPRLGIAKLGEVRILGSGRYELDGSAYDLEGLRNRFAQELASADTMGCRQVLVSRAYASLDLTDYIESVARLEHLPAYVIRLK